MPHARLPHPLRAICSSLALLAFLTTASAGWCKVVYVNRNASGSTHDGASWSTACLTVQAGINAASSGDEVWVAAGTYVENVTLTNSVALYGGFAGTETDRVQRNWKANASILDGNGSTSGCIVTSSSSDMVLDGFTVRNGFNGVYGNAGTTAVANCTISSNTNYGIEFGTGGTATVSNCTLTGNGVGVGLTYRTATIADCTFSRNGVGISGSYGSATIEDCTLSANGSGVSMVYGSASASNCTITGNTAGITMDGSWISPKIANCIVAFNGRGIGIAGDHALATLTHNNVFGNTQFNYQGVSDPTGVDGNISQDPLLSNIYHDVHVQPGSPCIDAGINSEVTSGWTDIDGQPRIIEGTVDIGSDESDGTRWSVPSRTWYVSSAGSDGNDGTSWTNAKKTVRSGLAVAQGTDEVWVVKGTYVETVSASPGVALYGGFAGTETVRSQRGWKANATILDGSATSGAVIRISDMGVVMNGFTVRNGETAIDVYGPATIANCIISGRVYGVNMSMYPATVTKCTVRGCSTGIFVANGPATISSCDIRDNSTNGIRIDYGTANVSNCTIFGNGYGIYTYAGTASVTNCIVSFNQTGVTPKSSSVALSHNDVYGNTTANYTDITDPTGTNGNISLEPIFVSQSTDLRLFQSSPCIDAGDDAGIAYGAKDLDGNQRISGAHVDIGAYEYGSVAATAYTLNQILYALKSGGGLAKPISSVVASLNIETATPGLDICDAVRLTREVAVQNANQ